MEIKVNKDKPFAIPTTRFAIGATSGGFVLNYSNDGEHWTAYDNESPADECVIVNFSVPNLYFRLEGNEDENVLVTY